MSLGKQATALGVMYAADVLQPLLILPYAGWVLGVHGFGQYALALSIGVLASTLVSYGCHWTGQRAAASAREDPAQIAKLFADITSLKTGLCVVVLLGGLAAAGSVLPISRTMFLCVMPIVLGNILFPPWLFIGLERAWNAAVAVVISRTVALACFFTLVTSPEQVELAVAIQAAIPFVSGLITLPFIIPIGLEGFRSMTLHRVARQFWTGRRGFLFSFVEMASTSVPVLLVGHLGGYAAAGQYSVAEKFVGATRPVFKVITDTLLPRIAYSAEHAPQAGISLIWKSLATLVVGVGLSLSLFFIAPYIIIGLFGEEFSGAIPIVRVMAIIPILANVNICTSNLYMFNYGHEQAWSRLTVFGFLVFLMLTYILSMMRMDAALAVAISLIAKETLVLLVSSLYFLIGTAARARASRALAVTESATTGRPVGAPLVLLARRGNPGPRRAVRARNLKKAVEVSRGS